MRNLEDYAGIASDWFWETDANHCFTYFSSRMQEVTHIPPAQMLGRPRVAHPLLCNRNSDFKNHLEDLHHRRPFRDLEYRIKRTTSDGFLWLRVSGNPVFDDEGTFLGYRGSGHDITKEKDQMARLEAANRALTLRNKELNDLRRELELAAFEDPLTGLKNRRAFDAAIAEALKPTAPKLALLLIDLDRFKQVNDRFGHPAGDMVLMTAAGRLSDVCIEEAGIYRMGGDEFAILVHGAPDMSDLAGLADDLVTIVSGPMNFEGQELSIGISVGLAVAHGVPTSPHRLIAAADQALYSAKKDGRNCARLNMNPHLSAG